MYNLTISARGNVIRTIGPAAARQTLRDWFNEETTGYEVVCKDEGGAIVTRGQLRVQAEKI